MSYTIEEICEEALTHGLYSSEVHDDVRMLYIAYACKHNRADLVDTLD